MKKYSGIFVIYKLLDWY